MNSYNHEDNTSRRWGAAALLLYLIGVVCVMLFVSFDFSREEQMEEGILINFGASEVGSGEEDLAATDLPVPPPVQSVAQEEVVEEPLVDERSEVAISTLEQEVQEVKESPRKVNRKALFPGRTPASEAVSQGESTSEERGNAGSVSGTPDGVEYTLTGRSIVGELPKPAYRENVTGKVVVDVVVNEQGRVTNATYRAQGSTTNNSALIEAARSAALKARFSESESFVQGGTITYIFKMD